MLSLKPKTLNPSRPRGQTQNRDRVEGLGFRVSGSGLRVSGLYGLQWKGSKDYTGPPHTGKIRSLGFRV